MNKKLFSIAALMLSVLTGCVFTSCLDGNEEDSENIAQGYFTTDGNATQIILHQDGGGTLIPAMSSFKDASTFLKNERYILQFKYRKGDVSEDYMTVTGAEIIAGEVIDSYDVLSSVSAADQKISDADSLFAISNISRVWACRGYLTVLARAYYSLNKDGKGILPTYRLVIDPESGIQPDRIRMTLCYNRHSAQDAQKSSSVYEMATSFRLNQLAGMVPGTDSVEVSIEGKDLGSATTFKVSRQDFLKTY